MTEPRLCRACDRPADGPGGEYCKDEHRFCWPRPPDVRCPGCRLSFEMRAQAPRLCRKCGRPARPPSSHGYVYDHCNPCMDAVARELRPVSQEEWCDHGTVKARCPSYTPVEECPCGAPEGHVPGGVFCRRPI